METFLVDLHRDTIRLSDSTDKKHGELRYTRLLQWKRGHLCGRRDRHLRCRAFPERRSLAHQGFVGMGTSSYAGDAQNPGTLHVADALKRTWDTSLNYSVASGNLSIVIRSNSASERPSLMTWYLPEYLVNIWPGITRYGFFWVEDHANPSLCWTFAA